ncbi:thiamine phosphate synthase [Rhizobium tumorigenes]|uniref:Thiamine phosphate synthase n=1 Tax=Rhizobium tumorigenes TaxID=2041385 RepID=A0AAF1KPX6_9HYPH|nr:thiamine phosphate synthase [Rhizobium tumorigenes]WFR94523.1 thiamine phosphate synthase [Rhizobium tumorigenes]
MTLPPSRCRLVLIVPEMTDIAEQHALVAKALEGGDVASVIIPQYGVNEFDFQKSAEKLVPIVQAAGAAALIAGDSRVAARAKADGLHIAADIAEFTEAMEKQTASFMVGGGTAKDRHTALEIGELRPDYIFFGKFDGDFKPEAHPKNVDLGEWWASMIEIPCIVMGGTDPNSALDVALAGVEFVALRSAVFADAAQASSVVSAVNALLDEKAPRFED